MPVKRAAAAFIIFLLISLAAAAQTPPIPVAVMPFVGDEQDITGRIRSDTVREVDAQEGFTPQDIAADMTGLRPDEPPSPALLSGLTYVLTGEYYLDIEGLHHAQLWLWNSESGALVYTDELVAQEQEYARGYLPALVAWVFSKILVRNEVVTFVEAPPAAPVPEAPREPKLFAGLRLGAALDFQPLLRRPQR